MTSLIPHTLKPPLGYRIDPFHPLSRGLVACYLMNERGGTQIFDLTQNGNTGAFVDAPEWVPDQDGPAIKLDGVNDYIDCENASILDLGDVPQTICIWFTPTVTINDALGVTRKLISRAESGTGAENDWTFDFNGGDGAFPDDNGRMRFGTFGGNIQTNIATWDAGRKYFVAVSYKSSTDASIYVDGIIDNLGGDFNPGAINGSVNNKLRIGVSTSNEGIAFWFGNIHEVLIFNRALSTSEIAQLHREPYAFIRPILPIEWMSFVAAVTAEIVANTINYNGLGVMSFRAGRA